MSDEWSEDVDVVLEELEDEELEDEERTSNHSPDRLEDAHMAETVAHRALTRFCWAGRGLGWMRYQGGRWIETNESAVAERVRRDLIDQHAREAHRGAETHRLQKLSGLLSASRIRAIVKLCEGIIERDPSLFDQQPDLLNVGNGVIDLRTGELLRHDADLLLTKITRVNYTPEAVADDWSNALRAVSDDVADWLQIRVGQAATGHPTSDDVLPILQGGGSNGKTTITGSISRVLGDHAVMVPERALMANKTDHPTELMPLRGARFALIEETPEARHLNVKRLKDAVGTPTMTARKISRDNVTWQTTHSLFITSNYVPRVDEVDHGTWRRLALVRFPHRFVPAGEPRGPRDLPAVAGLRERLRDGRHGEHEAILAWIVAGARRWYAADRVIPPKPAAVVVDTQTWRADADLIWGYVTERLIFDAQRHVISTELFEDYCRWLAERGHKPVAEVTFSSRFEGHALVAEHHVPKRRIRAREGISRPSWGHAVVPKQYNAWLGVRFRSAADDDDLDDIAVTSENASPCRGVQGQLVGSHEGGHMKNDQITLHTPAHSRFSDQLTTSLLKHEGRCGGCGRHIETQGHALDCEVVAS